MSAARRQRRAALREVFRAAVTEPGEDAPPRAARRRQARTAWRGTFTTRGPLASRPPRQSKAARKAARAAAAVELRRPDRLHAATARSVAIQSKAGELYLQGGELTPERWSACVGVARAMFPAEYTP